jgi:hypothetical protein
LRDGHYGLDLSTKNLGEFYPEPSPETPSCPNREKGAAVESIDQSGYTGQSSGHDPEISTGRQMGLDNVRLLPFKKNQYLPKGD